MNIHTSNPDADYRFLAELPDGRCLLSCHKQNAVLVVDSKAAGNVTGRLEGVEFSRPEGIAIDQQGRVLVVDRYNHCIRVFDSQLTYQTRIGAAGTGDAEFNQPVGIAVSPVDGRIWIADNENHRVQALDGSTFSTSLGLGLGTKPGQLYCPCGIALYNHAQHGELVIVSEWGGGRVQVFKTNGDVFAIFAAVQHAHHVAVDADGNVIVSEYATRKIKRFSLDGEWKELQASTVSIGPDWFVTQDRVLKRSRKRKQQDDDMSCFRISEDSRFNF